MTVQMHGLGHDSSGIGSHTFLVTGLLSGKVIDEVDIQSFNVNEVLNRPGGGAATARIESPSTNDQNFLSWANALWCIEGDNILWGGIIGDVQPRASTRVLNIPLYGFMTYYETQPVRVTALGQFNHMLAIGPNWSFTSFNPPNYINAAVSAQHIDQFLIFEDLIMHVGRRDVLSNIRPEVRYEGLSGVLRDDIVFNWEYKMAGTLAQQIADRENGFFWHTRFHFDSNSPAFHFHLHHPLLGSDLPIIYDWDAQPEETNLMEYDFGGEEKPANSVIVVGAGEADKAKVARKESTASSIGAFSGGRPRYYEVVTLSEVTNQTTLQAHANKRWDRHKIPFKTASVKMQNPEDEFLAFELGDTVNLRIDDHSTQLFDRFRVVSKSTVLTDTGDKVVTLEMEEPFVVFEEE
jgi:hypothetical protein